MDSPCINVCYIDPATGFCIGCCRTRREIAMWPTLNETEKALFKVTLVLRRGEVKNDCSNAKDCPGKDSGN